MGAHVSKVLSIRIDTWSEEQLQAMEAKGNAAVNAQLEAEVRRSEGPYPLSRSVAASRSSDLPPKSHGGANPIPDQREIADFQIARLLFAYARACVLL